MTFASSCRTVPAVKLRGFAKVGEGYGRTIRNTLKFRGVLIGGYLAAAGVVLWLVGSRLGSEIFPSVDAGQLLSRAGINADNARMGIGTA